MSKQPHQFGYQRVSAEEKTSKVKAVFHSVASRYDLMNDLMSLGVHRLWKRFAIKASGVRPNSRVLDVAGGTGDLTELFAQQLDERGQITLSDINPRMLAEGKKRLIDEGLLGKVTFVEANAENLPFEEHAFDVVTMAFGLRNVTQKEKALQELYRVLDIGGRVVILEFSTVILPIVDKLYDIYSFKLLPKLGEWIAKDGDSYQYLAESIRVHPDQETLLHMMKEAGFERCRYHNLSGGMVAVHIGEKL